MSNVTEIPLSQIQVIGLQKGNGVVLGSFTVTDPSKREAVITEILENLAGNDVVVIGNTVVFTENYDAFRVV